MTIDTYLRYEVTGMRMDAPGNRTPSMMSNGSRRGNFMDEPDMASTDQPRPPNNDTRRGSDALSVQQTHSQHELYASGFTDKWYAFRSTKRVV